MATHFLYLFSRLISISYIFTIIIFLCLFEDHQGVECGVTRAHWEVSEAS